MQLGEQSAAFSRSQLRQRIDKTSQFLGIDFPTNHATNNAQVGEENEDVSRKSVASIPAASIVTSSGKSLEDALKVLQQRNKLLIHRLLLFLTTCRYHIHC